MTDLGSAAAKSPETSLWTNSQAVVAGMVISALTVMGVGLLVVAYFDHTNANLAYAGVGTIVGALATALSTPRGRTDSKPQ